MEIQHELCLQTAYEYLPGIYIQASWLLEAHGRKVGVVTSGGKPVKLLF